MKNLKDFFGFFGLQICLPQITSRTPKIEPSPEDYAMCREGLPSRQYYEVIMFISKTRFESLSTV